MNTKGSFEFETHEQIITRDKSGSMRECTYTVQGLTRGNKLWMTAEDGRNCLADPKEVKRARIGSSNIVAVVNSQGTFIPEKALRVR